MVSEDEFWQLMSILGRSVEDDDVERLTTMLAARPEADITGFADRLAAVLWALDTPAHFEAAHTAGDDSFLYIRCAVVAAGRKAYDRVLRKPAALRKFADEEAELLLTVAVNAYERATGLLWEHETPVSYEMGSNTAAWGEATPGVTGPEPEPRWLELMFGSSGPAGPPDAYALLLHEVVDAVAADPAWQRWWAAAGVPLCELSLLVDCSGVTPPEQTVKRGRKRVRVDVVRAPGPFPVLDASALLALAVDEIRDLLELARSSLGSAPLPPLVPPPLPTDLPPELFAPHAGPVFVPGLPDELLQQAMNGGSLGPEQIIDYFRAHPDAEGAAAWLAIDMGDR